MATNPKNLRVCRLSHASKEYDLIVGVGDLDEIDDILMEVALTNFGITLDLPQDLLWNKAITEVLTTLDIDEFVYISSPVSAYMDKPRFTGISGTFPTLPTELNIGGFYVLPSCLAFLWSEAGFDGYYGEYIIPASQNFTLVSGINYIGVMFNSGAPIYFLCQDFAQFDFSSKIPVVAVLNFGGEILSMPWGQTGYGLPEKRLMLENKKTPIDIMESYTLETTNNYVELGALAVRSGVNEVECPAVDTSVSNNDMYLHYKDGSSVWQSSKVTQINNTQYQTPASGLASLGAGEFVINNIFRVVDGTLTLLFSVLSNKFTSLQAAIDSTDIVDVPAAFASAVHVGRIIVEVNSTTPTIQTIRKNPWGTV